MSLDATLTLFLHNDPWFEKHPAARDIIIGGNQSIELNKSNLHNLQALLANMCGYGAAHWQYAPGMVTSADDVLGNRNPMTDCKSLADIFIELVLHLPIVVGRIQARIIERENHRIVTKPGLVTFNGRHGSSLLAGRWCFGDHWVVEIDGLCYDPTFKVCNFPFGNPPHIDWYALDEEESGVHTRSKWTHINHRTIYITQTGEYTFDRMQARSVKKAPRILSTISRFKR